MKKRLQLKIFGQVQGVSFRYYAEEEAKRQGLTGYIKNLDDGTVESLAEGEEKGLKSFIDWCYNGSPASQVTKVNTEWGIATGEYEGFNMKRI